MLWLAMRPPRYPLEPLVGLREEKVDAAVRGLATAVAARSAAELARRTAEHRRDAHAETAARVREAEGQALGRGELYGADLARAGAWETRVASEREAMASEVGRTLGAEAQAHHAERQAREEAASRKADAEVVATDRARWGHALCKREQAREEEAAEEAFRRKP
jgi:hypothetical protein